jgi:hypothetical protein
MTLKTEREKSRQGVLQQDKQNTVEKLLSEGTPVFEQSRHFGLTQKVRRKKNTKQMDGMTFALIRVET